MAHVHVRAAEGFLPEIDGLEAKPPRLSRADIAALLGQSNGDGQSRSSR